MSTSIPQDLELDIDGWMACLAIGLRIGHLLLGSYLGFDHRR